jgi:hypothetical protein
MMAEYIDREALLKKLYPYDVVDKKTYAINAEAIYREIKKAPATDVVEVVRCKDCAHWSGEDMKDYLLGERWGECHRPFGSYGCENSTENDFCSYGERREVCEKD